MPYRENHPPTASMPEEKYRRDPHYHALVDVLESAIHAAQYTPTEVREAAMLAAIHYEMRRGMPGIVFHVRATDPATERVDMWPMSEADMARLVEQLRK